MRVVLEDFGDIFDRVTQAIDARAKVTSQLWPNSTEIFRYPPGPGFGWHRDDEFRQGGVVQRARRSFFSFVIFLNDAYQGGELAFESGIRSTPQPGLLVAWPAALRHRVSPIVSERALPPRSSSRTGRKPVVTWGRAAETNCSRSWA